MRHRLIAKGYYIIFLNSSRMGGCSGSNLMHQKYINTSTVKPQSIENSQHQMCANPNALQLPIKDVQKRVEGEKPIEQQINEEQITLQIQKHSVKQEPGKAVNLLHALQLNKSQPQQAPQQQNINEAHPQHKQVKNEQIIKQESKPMRQIKLTSSQTLITPQTAPILKAAHRPSPLLMAAPVVQPSEIKSPLQFLEQAHIQQQHRQYVQYQQAYVQYQQVYMQQWNNNNYYGSPRAHRPVRVEDPPNIRQVSSIIVAQQHTRQYNHNISIKGIQQSSNQEQVNNIGKDKLQRNNSDDIVDCVAEQQRIHSPKHTVKKPILTQAIQ